MGFDTPREKNIVKGALYAAVFVSSILPLTCGYLMSGGRVMEWAQAVQNGETQNLCLFICALCYRISGSVVFTYECYMLLIQLGTMAGAYFLFCSLFSEKASGLPVFFGVLLYMTCPFRLFICYDRADLPLAGALMLLPFLVGGLISCLKNRKLLPGFPALFFAAALCAAFLRPIPDMQEAGYHIGEFFTTFAYPDGRPGLGLGIMLGLLCALWLKFVCGETENSKSGFFFTSAGLICLIAALRYPLFMGEASLFFAVPGAYAVKRLAARESRALSFGVPALIFFACMMQAFYLCNMLVYVREPLIFS